MDRNALAGFAGAYRDRVTLAHPLGNGYRWYLPWLMRFNAPDSSSPFGVGGVHAYAYCEADPINRTDPSGHMFEDVDKMLGRLSLASDTTKEATSTETNEASSLAAETSKRAGQEASGTPPSSSGASNMSSTVGSLVSRRGLKLRLTLPSSLRPGPLEVGAVDKLMKTYRGTAKDIVGRALVLRRQGAALNEAASMARGGLGVADPIAAQQGRLEVQLLALDADHLYVKLSHFEKQLVEHTGEFKKELAEIRGLRERVGAIHREAQSLDSKLRVGISVTGFDDTGSDGYAN